MFNAHEFAARLSAREDRWSLLKDFIAEWHRPLEEGDGYSAEEVDTAERRLGLKLPLALREWYGLAGQREDVTAVQNFLRSPGRLFTQEQDGAEVLCFYTENQACVNWGILVNDLALDDPPVYLDETGGAENRTLSEFITQMVVLETACFTKMGGNAFGKEDTADIVTANFQPLGLPAWHWPSYPAQLYGSDDVLIELDQDSDKYCWVWVAALTDSALDKTVKMLNLEWEYLYNGIPINETN